MKLKSNFLKIQLQPIAICLLGLIVGILSYIYLEFYTSIILLLFICFSLLVLFFLNKISFKMLILFSIYNLGFITGYIRTYIVNKNHKDIIEKTINKTANIYGLVYFKQQNNTDNFFKNKIFIKIDKISIKNNNNKEIINTNYTVKINYPDFNLNNLNNITEGNYIKIKDINLIKKRQNTDFLIAQNCLCNLFLSKIDYKIINKKFSFLRRIWLKIIITRQNLLNRLNKKLTGITKTLFNYIFLGIPEDSNNANKLKQYAIYWGISHYLARSGLHLVMIIFIWSLLFRFVPIRYNLKKIIVLFLSLIYGFLTIKSISFNRAFLTIIIYNICDLKKLAINSIHVINMVCFVNLLSNPYKLFLLDFQLSFILTFIICYIRDLKFRAILTQKT
ncbi:MAG: ComEC/Rec2 family competence protein [Novosphingobium sp.]|nr:ComEC/Rec2 family competence protein [Novosphingobium sp.]